MAGRLCTTLFALALMSAPAAASGLGMGGEAPPLPAWVGFCDREPAECAVDRNEPVTIALTRETEDLIDAVNRHVNRTISPITDRDHWDVLDQWNLPSDSRGDCEDYQLLKRKLLVEAGLPRRALRMVVVLNALGEGHAVLMVRTDRGDLILDNLSPDVLRWQATGYRFIKRESEHRVGWVWLAPEARLQVAAAQE